LKLNNLCRKELYSSPKVHNSSQIPPATASGSLALFLEHLNPKPACFKYFYLFIFVKHARVVAVAQ